MISIRLSGGMADQMFQCACALALAERRKLKVNLDLRWLDQQERYNAHRFSLGVFGVSLESTPSVGPDIRETGFAFDPKVLDLPDGANLVGCFQSERYFADQSDLIRQTFRFPSDKNLGGFLSDIQSGQVPVAVHVRRGEYIQGAETYAFHGICGLPYYERALGFFRNAVPGARFYVFTDDPDWARHHLVGPDFELVETPAGAPDWYDLARMSLCDHNIIANSSYSWWAAWLNANPNKIVVAPDRWFFDQSHDTRNLLPEAWIRLPNYSCRWSVVIPTHNCLEKLKRAVVSVESQTEQDIEILICDDGSTDGTWEWASTLPFPRYRYLHGSHSGGNAAPRNRGVRAAQGEFIAFLDSDDTWYPDKLGLQLAAHQKGADLVASNGLGSASGQPLLPFRNTHRLEFRDLLQENLVFCSSASVRADSFRVGPGFPEVPRLKAWEDYAAWLAYLARPGISAVLLGQNLVLYDEASVDSKSLRQKHPWTWYRSQIFAWVSRGLVRGTQTEQSLRSAARQAKVERWNESLPSMIRTIVNKSASFLRRLSSQIGRAWDRLTQRKAPSGPFLSGDGYREMAVWHWDEWLPLGFDPKRVQAGDRVFISNWHMEAFWRTVDPLIGVPYILVSSNGDVNVTPEQLALRRPQSLCRHWFSQNVMTKSGLVTPLPIGLENRRLHWFGDPKDFQKVRASQSGARLNRILFGFSVENCRSERERLLAVLRGQPLAEACPKVNAYEYRRLVSRYKFVASPPGNGEDCHRTWEALYLGAVPIVRRSPGLEYFQGLGIPVWIVDDWSELARVTEDDLWDRYDSMKPNFNNKALNLKYWQELIRRPLAQLGGGT